MMTRGLDNELHPIGDPFEMEDLGSVSEEDRQVSKKVKLTIEADLSFLGSEQDIDYLLAQTGEQAVQEEVCDAIVDKLWEASPSMIMLVIRGKITKFITG